MDNIINAAVEQMQANDVAATAESVAEVVDLQPAVEDPLDNPTVNQAAYTFQTSLPRIKALSGNMSRNALARVFKAVVEFPLAESYPKFRNKIESELFILTLSAMSAKNVMTSAITKGREQEIENTVTDNVVNDILSKMSTEEKNG